jgi:hypothetical protein
MQINKSDRCDELAGLESERSREGSDFLVGMAVKNTNFPWNGAK